MKTIDIGALVHQVEIQRRVSSVDTSGAPQEDWVCLTVAAMGRLTEGQAQRGTEAFRADQITASIVTRWVMRYWPEMDPDRVDVPAERRLVYLGRAYDIVQAELIDRQAGILLRTIARSTVTA